MMKKLFLIFLASTFLPTYLFANCDPLFTQTASTNGDTICRGEIIDFFGNSTMNGTITTVQYNFGDGNFAFSDTSSHSYIQSGTYTVVYTIGSTGCSPQTFKDTIYVIDPPMGLAFSSNASCFGVCDGTTTMDIQIAPHGNYNFLWDDSNTQTTAIATGLCASNYSVTISDAYGCNTSFNATVNEPAEIVVQAGSDIQICDGSQWPIWDAAIVSGGQAPFTYLWTPGDSLNYDTILNPIITAGPSAYGVYTLTVTDADGCSGSNDLQVTQSPGAISGTVRNQLGGSGLPSILVSLIKRNDLPDTEWETYATTLTDPNGDYQFLNLPLVDYIVKAEPTQTVPAPEFMPTYYHVTDTVFDWIDAQITSVDCGTMYGNTDIDMIEIPHLAGTCTFEGYVYLVCTGPCKTQTEDPIPLIDVIVKKTPPGNAIAWTQTGDGTQAPTLELGQFRFENMPASLDSTYSFVVNIPGLGMQSNYSIEVAFDDSLYGNLNFYVDTTQGSGGIYTYNPLGVEALKYKPHEMIAYPNPFADNCELRFTNSENTGFAFTLYDVTGKQIMRDEQEQGNTYTINTQTLDQGIYIAEVKTGEEVFRTRVMKK